MANVILIKRGMAENIDSANLQEGELALAFDASKKSVQLYAGNGEGKILVNSVAASDMSSVLSEAKGYTDEKIRDLINGAPAAYDTLKEIADYLGTHETAYQALTELVGNKVTKENGKGLSSNDYTTAEKTKLAGIAEGANNYTHPASHSADMISTTTSKQFVSSSEKTTWNAKLGSSSTIDGGTF